MNYADKFSPARLSLKDVWHQKHTHKQRFISVSLVTTCRSSSLPIPATWRVFVFPSTRLCVHSWGVHFHFHPCPSLLSPGSPPSLSPSRSLLPYLSPLLIRKCPRSLYKESLFCQSCGNDGGEEGEGIYCQMSFKAPSDELNPQKAVFYQKTRLQSSMETQVVERRVR